MNINQNVIKEKKYKKKEKLDKKQLLKKAL